MRVFLEESLFEGTGADDPLPLIGLVSFARQGRHRILMRPAFRENDERDLSWNRWLLQRDERVRAQLTQLLRVSARDASTDRPGAPHITVVEGDLSDWDHGRLSVDDASSLLRAPLRVLFENGRTDWSFLLALVDGMSRETLRDAEKQQWLEIKGVGGIGELKKWIEDLLLSTQRDSSWNIKRLRAWMMFDKDADPSEPREASKTSAELVQLCLDSDLHGPWSFAHLQLARRTIESYLPLESLRSISNLGNGVDRSAALKALREHHPEESFAYNMKEGFIKDSGIPKKDRHKLMEQWKRTHAVVDRLALTPSAKLPEAWRALPEAIVSDLLFGFGSDIAKGFEESETEPKWEGWFAHEHARGPIDQPLRSDVANTLLELI